MPKTEIYHKMDSLSMLNTLKIFFRPENLAEISHLSQKVTHIVLMANIKL